MKLTMQFSQQSINSEEPSGNNFSSSTSICSSSTSASTVVAANGHISSARRNIGKWSPQR
ncbi:hypothetical protein E2C01_078595 [Portunus trituberculatus]|uniref:Uncharacterized protein n=1 Tax=Portunus trituberculatus TaxID=210409 RepID=A0A5B7IUJ4_PORTR|nr:hypothetical protein [Portunus trituberculatus]